MTSRERMKAALGGQETDRVPFFPCLAADYACTALGHHFEKALVDPRLGVRWMVEAGFFFGCDAVRVRPTPPRAWFEAKAVRREGRDLVQVDLSSGRMDGRFDVEGGGSLIPAHPPRPGHLHRADAGADVSLDRRVAGGRQPGCGGGDDPGGA